MKRNLIMNILPLFAWLLDSFGILLIPIPLVVTAFVGIRNAGKATSRKELNICNVVLLISCVCGEALSTYYYYHNVSSDYMTNAVGVLAVIIAAAEVLILAVINNIFVSNLKKQIQNKRSINNIRGWEYNIR